MYTYTSKRVRVYRYLDSRYVLLYIYIFFKKREVFLFIILHRNVISTISLKRFRSKTHFNIPNVRTFRVMTCIHTYIEYGGSTSAICIYLYIYIYIYRYTIVPCTLLYSNYYTASVCIGIASWRTIKNCIIHVIYSSNY